ncbi:DegV family protein [Latilactobacillus graminis]|uniref:EDD domain protein, DegV family n=2 Tax=Latilactobacillus graminis TaxID=60519 RepID=A0AA89I489_9LACO|nr:DegV family protein [Latilactobacillus graminis]KRM21941.1 hypothetical protein FC90_GL001093 [Latilactobacillus graminis DSM 20719]QFP79629.1 DegV family protein [Latilactobacillus graminis]
MAIKIITDSSISLTPTEIAQYKIHIAPLMIQHGSQSFIDGQTITRSEFLERLVSARDEFPTTSQPTVGSLVTLYDELGADGSTLLSIHCTGLLSGTVEGAHIAAQQSTSDVHVLDSKAIDRSLAYQVTAAAADAAAGQPLDVILAHLADIRQHSETYIFLDSLDALQRGGRISRLTGLLTKLIKLKVVARLTDTQLEIIAKGRGNKTFVKEIEQIKTNITDQNIIEIDISHVGLAPDSINKIQKSFQQDHPRVPSNIALPSPVIMSHVGLNAFGIFYHTK